MTPPPEESTLREDENTKYLLEQINKTCDAYSVGEQPKEEIRWLVEGHIESLVGLIQERERLARIDEITNSYDLTDHKDKRLKDLGKQAVKGDK